MVAHSVVCQTKHAMAIAALPLVIAYTLNVDAQLAGLSL